MAARSGAVKWLPTTAVVSCLFGGSGCLISFDHYAEGDVCDAGRDAGIRASDAPDPVLRGCDAGPGREPKPGLEVDAAMEASAGAAGAEAGP